MELSKEIKPLTIFAIVVLAISTALGWMWVWGILYLYWAVMGAVSGSAFVIEDISVSESPILFWLINTMWAAAGIWTITISI